MRALFLPPSPHLPISPSPHLAIRKGFQDLWVKHSLLNKGELAQFFAKILERK